MSALAVPRDLAVELDRADITPPRETWAGQADLIAHYYDYDNADDAAGCIAFHAARPLGELRGMCRWVAGTPEQPIIIRWPVTA